MFKSLLYKLNTYFIYLIFKPTKTNLPIVLDYSKVLEMNS